MSSYQTIMFEQSERVAVITLNRPDAATRCQDVSVKAVVLTANGKFFCAGGDLREMAGFGDQGGVQIKSLAEGSLGANSMIKRLLLSTWNNDLESQMDAETKGISQCLSSEDGQEGMRAFLEKRKPVFM